MGFREERAAGVRATPVRALDEGRRPSSAKSKRSPAAFFCRPRPGVRSARWASSCASAGMYVPAAALHTGTLRNPGALLFRRRPGTSPGGALPVGRDRRHAGRLGSRARPWPACASRRASPIRAPWTGSISPCASRFPTPASARCDRCCWRGRRRRACSSKLDSLAALEEWRAFELTPKDWAARFPHCAICSVRRRRSRRDARMALQWRSQAQALDASTKRSEEAAAGLRCGPRDRSRRRTGAR